MGYAHQQPRIVKPPVQAHINPSGSYLAVFALALSLSATLVAGAQSGLEAAHISPTLYFHSNADELASRTALRAKVSREIEALASTPVQSLPKELDRCESLVAELQTHEAFLKIRTLEETQDQPAKKARNEVETDQSVLESAMDTRLRRLSPKEVPSLGRYVLLAKAAQRGAVHALSPDAERYRGGIVDPALTSFSDTYDRIENRLARPKEVNATDIATRRKALATWNEAYDQAAPEMATLLGAIVELENRDAVAQGYENAADRMYQLRGLSDALVTQTLAAVQAEAPAYRHYQEVLAQHAARVLGVSPVLSSEVDLASTKAPIIPLSEAKTLILSGLQPLGADYTNRLAALLNPANGRLDLAGGGHRARTGTSIDAYEAPTALYYSGYDGSLRDVSKIAHEGGHAIHHELMNAGGAPIYERSGPNYFLKASRSSTNCCCLITQRKLLKHQSKSSMRWSGCFQSCLWSSSSQPRRLLLSAAFTRRAWANHCLTEPRSTLCTRLPSPLTNIGPLQIWDSRASGCANPLFSKTRYTWKTTCTHRWSPLPSTTRAIPILSLPASTKHCCVEDSTQSRR